MNRNRYNIMREMLAVCSTAERGKTRIMYRCNLSWRQLNKHLSFLVEKGLLEEEHHSHSKFRTTERGRRYLKAMQDMEKELC